VRLSLHYRSSFLLLLFQLKFTVEHRMSGQWEKMLII
jgi:hypothetical protein